MEKTSRAEHTVEKILNYLKVLVDNGGPEESEYAQLDTATQTLYEVFQEGKINDNYSSEINNLFSEAFLENTLHGWSLKKPFGYSGDFKMIDYIYTYQHSNKKEFIKWDKYYHYHQSSKAVRNRKEYFKKTMLGQINGRKIHLLNVASGPARDLKECYDLLEDKAKLITTCVELDMHAIEFAKDLCRDNLGFIEFINKNIIRFNTAKRFDIIWSAGLFDYFKDRTFILVLKKLKCLLNPTGEIIIGNFCKSNPGQAYMELFCNWFLFHRTEQELKELALCAGFKEENISVDKEPLGINLFLRIRNNSNDNMRSHGKIHWTN
ncbi:MAG: class I SAM-dependent methyltransferase [Bacteroidetes bacterium]|nr:MAG: class I SAM-dependent methyltransferase [Bacteroidota bacterium]